MADDYGQGFMQDFENAMDGVPAHARQHEESFDAINVLKLIARISPKDLTAGTVLGVASADPLVAAFLSDVNLAGYFHAGATAAPGLASPGDGTFEGRMAIAKWLRVGLLTALTGATTNGDLVAIRHFIEDAKFLLSIVAGKSRITFDTDDYLDFIRADNGYQFNIATLGVLGIVAAGLRVPGYVSAGNAGAPANLTAGDVTGLRGHFGTDGAFSGDNKLEVAGKALISMLLTLGDDLEVIGELRTKGYISALGQTVVPANAADGDGSFLKANIGADLAIPAGIELQVNGDAKVTGNSNLVGTLDHDGAAVGLFGVGPAARQTIVGSRGGNAALTSLLSLGALNGYWIDGTTP